MYLEVHAKECLLGPLLLFMAKAILATPTLSGKEAVLFLNQMKKNESSPLSSKDKEIIEEIRKNKELFSSAIF